MTKEKIKQLADAAVAADLELVTAIAEKIKGDPCKKAVLDRLANVYTAAVATVGLIILTMEDDL